MELLVTGGAGRLGDVLCRLISTSGHVARAFDLPSVPWDNVEGVMGVVAYKGDVTDPLSISEACEGVDAVIHLAALLPPRSEDNRQFTINVNVEGVHNILKALKSIQEVPLIFASSISTYGITVKEKPPIKEDHTSQAHNIYSKSKIEAEKMIVSSGIPYVILRIAPLSVVDLVELPEVIPYREDQRVEFVHVSDAAQALFKAAMNPGALGKTFNIAGGHSWQMTGVEYIERFYGALGVKVDPVFSEEYTAVDWYDTSRSRFLGYQRTTFNGFLERLRVLGEQLGLR